MPTKTKQPYYCNPLEEELYSYKQEESRDKQLKNEALNLALLIMSPFFLIWLLLAIL